MGSVFIKVEPCGDGEREQRHGEVYVPVWMASVNSLRSVIHALSGAASSDARVPNSAWLVL